MQQKLRKVEDLKRQEGEDRDASRTQNPGLNPLQDLDALALLTFQKSFPFLKVLEKTWCVKFAYKF